MIRIRYSPGNCTIHISGHAGYAPQGQDVVCAGVSALYCALRRHSMVLELHDEAKGERMLRPLNRAEMVMLPIFETIAGGMRDIAKKYPEHVAFEQV